MDRDGGYGDASVEDHSGEQEGDAVEMDEPSKPGDEDAKRAAMRDIPAPIGFRRMKVPDPTRIRTIVYDHGVRFEEDRDEPDPKKQKWLCASSASCRKASLKGKGAILHHDAHTGNITRHLRQVHGIVSARSATAKKKKARLDDAESSDPKAVVKANHDPGRAMLLMYVKVFIVAQLLAFGLSDSPGVKSFFEMCGDSLFPQAMLSSKMIKHCVAELYSATISKFSRSLRNAIAGVGGAVLHANFDLWTSKTSNEKFVGLRLFWCTAAFVIDSALVAVKPFQPSAELSEGEQLSGALSVWAEEVLKELGLETKHLFSTVTDAGSDVQRLCLKAVGSEWEWCFPHMLNCALVEAFGTTASRAACKNGAARRIIDAVRKVAQHLNKSSTTKVKFENVEHLTFGKCTKLVNADPRRWIVICNILEELLRSWEAIREHYEENDTGATFHVAGYRTEIEELYSLMKPAAVLIQDSQQAGSPTGLGTFLDLVMLRVNTLGVNSDLTITLPLAEQGGTTATNTTERKPEDLREVTKVTRRMLFDAVGKRFFDKRYDEKVPPTSPSPGYVFEMAACMSPYFVQLQWLGAVCSSSSEADRVRKLIKAKVVQLMVAAAEGAGEGLDQQQHGSKKGDGGGGGGGGDGGGGSGSGGGGAGGSGGGGDSGSSSCGTPVAAAGKRKDGGVLGGSSFKKKKHKPSALMERLLKSSVFGGEPSRPNAMQACQQEFDRFQERFSGALLTDYPVGDLLDFWADSGQAVYPHMARVARILLSVPASSAVLERDFSTAGRLATGPYDRVSAPYMEMVLFLHANQEHIPDVPELSSEEAIQAIPRRLSNPRKEAVDLSRGESLKEDGCDEYAFEMVD